MNQVIFFNVGQGNCTVLRNKNRDGKWDVWFVDAGSKHDPHNTLDFDEKIKVSKVQLVNSICLFIGDAEGIASLHFVISHLDEDHKNLIPLILLYYTDTKGKLLIQNIKIYTNPFDKKGKDILLNREGLLMQKKKKKEVDEEEKKKEDEKKNWFQERKHHVIIKGEECFNWNGVATTDAASAAVEFLNNKGKVRKDYIGDDDNVNSLVVRFKSGDVSVLLTGDATKTTWENCKTDRTASIYQLSHHGAATDNSTTDILLGQVKPECCVISSHLFSIHNHPAPSVVSMVKEYFSGKDPNPNSPETNQEKIEDIYHFLSLQMPLDKLTIGKTGNPAFFPVLILQKNSEEFEKRRTQTVFATRYPIYHTASNGTLIFSWNPTVSQSVNVEHRDFNAYTERRKKVIRLTDDQNMKFSWHDTAKITRRLLNESKNTHTPLAINAVGNTFDTETLEGFNSLQVISLKASDRFNLTQNEIEKFVNEFPQLTLLEVTQNQLANSFRPTHVESRFLGLV